MAVTGETTGINIWTQSSVTANQQFKPEQACRLNTTGAELEYVDGYARTSDVVIATERIQIAVTGAGAGKRNGIFDIWLGQ